MDATSGGNIGNLGPREHSDQTSYNSEVLHALSTTTLRHIILDSLKHSVVIRRLTIDHFEISIFNDYILAERCRSSDLRQVPGSSRMRISSMSVTNHCLLQSQVPLRSG
jgi:hypothetical protein